jgi:hypothetical protein
MRLRAAFDFRCCRLFSSFHSDRCVTYSTRKRSTISSDHDVLTPRQLLMPPLLLFTADTPPMIFAITFQMPLPSDAAADTPVFCASPERRRHASFDHYLL